LSKWGFGSPLESCNKAERRGYPSLQTNVVYTRPKNPRTNDMRRESTEHLEMIDPVPMISGNIAKFINEKIEKLDFHFFVEFGAGNSTRYFLKQIYNAKKNVNYISLEYNLRWFLKTVEAIKSDFNPLIHKPQHLKLTPWSYAKCKKYLGGKNLSQLKIPDHLKRLPKAKKKLAGTLNYKMLTYRFSEKKRPSDGIFNITIGDLLKFDFILKKDFIKDQYGESPIKNEYIKAPFESLLKNIEKREKIIALFIIDGGPRFDILKRILDLEEKNKNFSPVIFLCDANRIFYNEQIKRRSNGVYIEGTNKTLNRGTMYENQTIDSADKVKFFYGKENISAHELIEKEVWYYNSVE
jgi:hypothetical protein